MTWPNPHPFDHGPFSDVCECGLHITDPTHQLAIEFPEEKKDGITTVSAGRTTAVQSGS
jgi:hypothetical protein